MRIKLYNFDYYTMTEKQKIMVEKVTKLTNEELRQLCDATEETMKETKGFNIGYNNSGVLAKNYLESYFRGISIVPERDLYVVKLDGVIVGSLQLVKPPANHQTIAFFCSIDNHFIAPWARGKGLGNKLLEKAETDARNLGFIMMKLSVRATRKAAIALYRKNHYNHWGTLQKYEFMEGEIVPGLFFYKDL